MKFGSMLRDLSACSKERAVSSAVNLLARLDIVSEKPDSNIFPGGNFGGGCYAEMHRYLVIYVGVNFEKFICPKLFQFRVSSINHEVFDRIMLTKMNPEINLYSNQHSTKGILRTNQISLFCVFIFAPLATLNSTQ